MAIRLSIILLALILGVQAFVGRDLPDGPFAEQPGADLSDVVLSVPPLDLPDVTPAAVQDAPPKPIVVTPAPPIADLAPAPESPGPAAPVAPQPQVDLTQTTPSAPAPAANALAEVTGSSVNLRAGPTTDARVLAQAREGDVVEWIGDPAPGWARVKHPLVDVEVYMSASFLRRLPQ